jgi:ADP-ribosylglycohydrolase
MEDKVKAALYGAFVADALSLGPHWVYNVNVIDKKYGVVDHFFAPLTSYHKGKRAGDLTHYGDQMLTLLEAVAAIGGFDIERFKRDWRAFMDTYAGYFDQATKATLQNMDNGWDYPDCGSKSTDLGGAARIAPLVAVYASDLSRLIESARAQTKLTHNNRVVIAGAEFFARVVYRVLGGSKPSEAMQTAISEVEDHDALKDWLADGMESRSLDSRPTIADFGQMCEIEAAFPATIHLIVKYEDNFKQALIANVMAGGDSAARGMLTGMVLGAYHGIAGIPEAWIAELNSIERINALISRLEG